uniref:Uncharacterized protein n=1 Tax=Toxoplasma gondii COUG TaxID=1074873 RepID=A0A2G8XPB6_TOXGO|nr:hypothetical protein TGCOUG_257540 [Toxoplasma gondii COUG]
MSCDPSEVSSETSADLEVTLEPGGGGIRKEEDLSLLRPSRGSRQAPGEKRDNKRRHVNWPHSESHHVNVHFPKHLSNSELPLLLENLLRQEGQQQLWRFVTIVTHEVRQAWLRDLRDAERRHKSASVSEDVEENPRNLSELLAVEKLMSIAPHTCVLCMPSEIITHSERVHRQRAHGGLDAEEQQGNAQDRSPYRRMLLLPLYTSSDLVREAVSEPRLSHVAANATHTRSEIEDLPRRLYNLMRELKCEARIVCVLEGVRAALTIPQPHVTTTALFSDGFQAGCLDMPSSGRLDACGSPALAVGSQLPGDTLTPGSAGGENAESMPVSCSFSAENLDELICMLLIDWGIDTQEPLNPAGTAVFLLGAVKQLRTASQLSALPVDLQQRPKKRRQMSLASAAIVNKLASDGPPVSSGSGLSHDASFAVPPPSPEREASATSYAGNDWDDIERTEEQGQQERGAKMSSSHHVWTFACRLWAEQLMQIAGVTDKVASAVICRFRRPAALLAALQTAEARSNRPSELVGEEHDSHGSTRSFIRGKRSGQEAKKQSRGCRRKTVTNAGLMEVVNEMANLEAPSAFTGSARTQAGATVVPIRALKIGRARAEKICRLFQEHVDSRTIL